MEVHVPPTISASFAEHIILSGAPRWLLIFMDLAYLKLLGVLDLYGCIKILVDPLPWISWYVCGYYSSGYTSAATRKIFFPSPGCPFSIISSGDSVTYGGDQTSNNADPIATTKTATHVKVMERHTRCIYVNVGSVTWSTWYTHQRHYFSSYLSPLQIRVRLHNKLTACHSIYLFACAVYPW